MHRATRPMRFGAALDLWHKGRLAIFDDEGTPGSKTMVTFQKGRQVKFQTQKWAQLVQLASPRRTARPCLKEWDKRLRRSSQQHPTRGGQHPERQTQANVGWKTNAIADDLAIAFPALRGISWQPFKHMAALDRRQCPASILFGYQTLSMPILTAILWGKSPNPVNIKNGQLTERIYLNGKRRAAVDEAVECQTAARSMAISEVARWKPKAT